jgi:hypothetical protein
VWTGFSARTTPAVPGVRVNHWRHGDGLAQEIRHGFARVIFDGGRETWCERGNLSPILPGYGRSAL